LKSGGIANYPATEKAAELNKIYQQTAAEIRRCYTISFYLIHPNGQWHDLRINLRSVEGSRNFALTYRQGY